MKLRWSYICLIPLLFALTGCEGIMSAKKQKTVPTSVELLPPKRPGTRQIFVSLLNRSHPRNRIGYRLFEHKPFVYGAVPKSSERHIETITANALERQFAARPGVFVHTVDVTNKDGWIPQTWTYYIVPVADGFDLLWVIATNNEGLNEYYVTQQCFRMSGKTNEKWRLAIAKTPAFSEYDLWQKQDAEKLSRTSLSFVRRNNKWQNIPPTKKHIVCRTPMGLTMDTLRSEGDLKKITAMEPYGPSQFEPDVDSGLATRSNLEDNWVCALYWQRTTHVSNHHPADCLHSFVNLGPLPPDSKRAIRGKIYWMNCSKDELFNRWQSNWPD